MSLELCSLSIELSKIVSHKTVQADLSPWCIIGSLLLNHIDHLLDGLQISSTGWIGFKVLSPLRAI